MSTVRGMRFCLSVVVVVVVMGGGSSWWVVSGWGSYLAVAVAVVSFAECPAMLRACCRAVFRSWVLMENVKAVTRAARVPTPAAAAAAVWVVVGFSAGVGWPWMAQSWSQRGFLSSMSCSSAASVAAASRFDIWLR